MRIVDIAEKDERLATLKALRQKIAETLDKSDSGRDVASLALQMQKVLIQIEELELEADDDDELDEIIEQHREQRVRRNKSFL